MGQEIVYCFQCQGRILGADFERGQAYQLGQRFVCSGCAAAVLPTLPLKERERLMADMFKATRDRRSTSSASLPVPDRAVERRKSTGRIPVVKRPPPPSGPAPQVLWAGGAAAVAVLVLVLWMASGSGSSPSPTSVVPPAPPRPVPAPAPAPDPRTATAREAMGRAESFGTLHPKDVEGAVREWEAAVKASENTGYARDAGLKLAEAVRRRGEAFGRELADLEGEAKGPLVAEEYKKAADLFKAAAGRHAHPDWSFALEKRVGEIYQLAAQQLAPLKDKAVLQQNRKEAAELTQTRRRVEKWGYPELLTELNQAVAAAPPPEEGPPWTSILRGRWSEELVKANAGWAWDGEALVLTKDNPRPGRTWDDYENGEIRVRFEAAGTTYAFFNVRQSVDGQCQVEILRPVFAGLGAGEHVLVITFRGSTLNCTLDGKPHPIEIVKRPRTGAFQFAPGNGKFRITSIEYRP
jgi:hypothetical protein